MDGKPLSQITIWRTKMKKSARLRPLRYGTYSQSHHVLKLSEIDPNLAQWIIDERDKLAAKSKAPLQTIKKD